MTLPEDPTVLSEADGDHQLPSANAAIAEAVTHAAREATEAAIVPAFPGSETPLQASQVSAEAVLENTTASAQSVQDKAVSGAKKLGARTLLSLGLRALSTFTLSHFLFPQNYGIFTAAAGIAGLGQYFCDAGMGSVLVTQEREPTDDEITTVFLLQQAFTAIVVLLIIACVPFLLSIYKAPPAAAPFLITMAIGLFPGALRLVPAVRLERKLDFGKQAKAEMIENVAQVSASIILAVLHFGTWALVGGAITARVVGLFAIYYVAPWKPRGRFRKEIALGYVGQGTQFQLNIIAPSLIGILFPMVISRLLGVVGLGLFGWAANLASVPLMLSSLLNRIAFPSLSRLQSNPAEIGRVTSVLVRRISMTLSVFFAPVILLSPVFLPLFFGRQWIPAIPLFQWAIMDTINYTTVGLLAQTLSATGHLMPRLTGTFIGGVTKVVFFYGAIHLFGLPGAGIGSYLGTLVELAVLGFYTRKYIAGSGKIAADIGLPLLGVQGAAAAGLVAAHALFGTVSSANLVTTFLSASVALAFFAVGLLTYNFSSKARPVTTELNGIMRLLRSRKGQVEV